MEQEKTYCDFTDELDEMIDLYLKFDNHKKFFEKYNEKNTKFSDSDFIIFQFVLKDVEDGMKDMHYTLYEVDAEYKDILDFMNQYKHRIHPKELIYNFGFNKDY